MRKIYAACLLLLFGFTAKAQNTCATPVAITAIPFNSGTLTTCGSGNDYAAGTLYSINYGGGEDYVFAINITTAPVTYNLTLGGAATYKIASVHSACPPSSSNALGGIVTSSGTTATGNVTFPTNGTYYIIVDTWPAPACGEFTLSVTVPPPAPACTTNITPVNGATAVAYLPGTQITWNAVPSATAYDVYYSNNGGTTYTNLGTTTATTIAITGNAPNTVYYWYIAPRNGPTPATGCQTNATSFTTGAVPAPPANDSCGAAIAVTASSTLACGPIVSGTTVSATASPGHPAPSCSVTGINDDVWFSFVATATSHKITLTNALNAVAAAVYTGTNCTLTQVAGACATGGPSVSGLTIGTTYYVRVYTTSSTITTYANFDICIGIPPPPPANDDCAGAITIGQYTGSVNGTTVAATQSLAAEVCASATGTANDDVWYRFTTLQAGSATISLTNASSSFDAVIIAYSGTCGSLTNIGCADVGISGESETLTLTGLAAGTTYYFRVYGYGAAGSEGTYMLTANGVALPVTGVVLSGIRNGDKAQLSWKTLTEINNAGFELQRSADGKYFSSIASIASKATGGNSTAAINYTIDDAKPFNGANYYRLKQMDKDGKLSYSNIVYLKGVTVSNLTLSALYPNPTSDVLKAAIQAPAAESITFVVMDMMGKTISRQVSNVISGDNTININVSNLPSGSYLLKAICRNGCETAYQKFTKQ